MVAIVTTGKRRAGSRARMLGDQFQRSLFQQDAFRRRHKIFAHNHPVAVKGFANLDGKAVYGVKSGAMYHVFSR